mmetsp:Transcript_22548/g.34076  ORF Transcript_22548/g.34076 Transcript_22548/m.34076 type:complete len:326 (+) Transcript_22548:205-1182(+)|eukprot:CAMPEP_0178915894 /NCGR_PEP_ID=MMETSP0786-20121207/12301_1 /TAXON_ID=186022 /ORGANISM="Thalassionema frauenfeldii, Strain CCMP 1798" /LENGTH=325 /DNA_ID=CAMNT_0020589097 /DNA_START=187 /DNA_END=1164 /DNA_ORIENTATION=+
MAENTKNNGSHEMSPVVREENKSKGNESGANGEIELTSSEENNQTSPSSSKEINPTDSITESTTKLSKKALKRKKRWEHKMALKKQRKEQARQAKHAKAALEGRDLEKVRREDEERRKNGEGWRRREKAMMDRIHASADNSFKVCLDCAFEGEMVFKEINSLSSQIRYCYASNKRASRPVYLSVTSLSGQTRSLLEKVDGFPEGWVGRGFDCHEESLEKIHDKKKLVYLTSDSTNILKTIEDDKIYVIGGIVDRNRLKRATINRAEELGIQTAKLPISQYLQLFSTKVLTCNHVFDILLRYRDCEENWKQAMLEVLPQRKDAKGI